MDTNWQNFLASRGARLEAGDACDFGDTTGELAATASDTVLAPLTHFGVIRASGEDAAGFLHNLLSNDIQHLGPGQAIRCGFCSPKGRLLADFMVWRDGQDFLLQLSADLQSGMLKKLGMYVLRSKVKLSDAVSNIVQLGIAGSGTADALDALGAGMPAGPNDVTHFEAGQAIRLDDGRVLLALQADAAAPAWDRLAGLARPVGAPAWRWLEIAAGIPHITLATQDEFVPQMANLELIGGVSFTKGCYPGQEIVARTKYLGKVKRRTYRANVQGGCPQAGTDLFGPELPDQACGKVIAAAPSPSGGCDILASMLMSSAAAGDVRVGGDGPRLSFLPLPYALE